MKCWHCNSEVIWGCDFSFEDFGMDGEGIVTTMQCGNCPASYEIYLPLDEEE